MRSQSDADQGVPVVDRSLPERVGEPAETLRRGPRVVDEQIQTACAGGDLVEHRGHRGVVGVIAGQRASAVGAGSLSRRDIRRPPVVDVRTSDAVPDAATAAGDESDARHQAPGVPEAGSAGKGSAGGGSKSAGGAARNFSRDPLTCQTPTTALQTIMVR